MISVLGSGLSLRGPPSLRRAGDARRPGAAVAFSGTPTDPEHEHPGARLEEGRTSPPGLQPGSDVHPCERPGGERSLGVAGKTGITEPDR